MVSRRVEGIPGFGIDRVADAAGSELEIHRLENYDTEIPPHADAVEKKPAVSNPPSCLGGWSSTRWQRRR